MSIITTSQGLVIVHCDVCGEVLDDFEAEEECHEFQSMAAALTAAEDSGWTVTEKTVSYGPRLITGFAVCHEDLDDPDHDAARALVTGSTT